MEFDDTVRTCPNYNLDEESDSDIDVDMSQPATSRGKTQTESYVDDLDSSELFELCSALDSLETESNDSNKENRALTPEYINPDSIADLDSYSPVDPEEQEIMDMWDRITFGPVLKQCTSNEIIDDAYRSHQEYLTCLISPAHTTTSRAPTPNPSLTLPQDKETLDWGSDEEKYVFPSSLCTPYIKDHTVLAPY